MAVTTDGFRDPGGGGRERQLGAGHGVIEEMLRVVEEPGPDVRRETRQTADQPHHAADVALVDVVPTKANSPWQRAAGSAGLREARARAQRGSKRCIEPAEPRPRPRHCRRRSGSTCRPLSARVRVGHARTAAILDPHHGLARAHHAGHRRHRPKIVVRPKADATVEDERPGLLDGSGPAFLEAGARERAFSTGTGMRAGSTKGGPACPSSPWPR